MRVCVKILVLYLVLLANICFGNINYYSFNNNNDSASNSVAICIEEIADISFSKVVVVVKTKGDNAGNQFIDKFIEIAIMNKPILITELVDLKDVLDIHIDNPLVVIHLENCEAVSDFDTSVIRTKVKYLVVILKSCKNNLTQIRDVVAVFDVTFILIDGIYEHELVTFRPHVNEKTCEIISVIEPVHLDVCNNGLVEKRKIFPMKNTVGFHGCTLNAGIAVVPPFVKPVKVKKFANLERIHRVTGSDVELLKIIAEQINATLKFYNVGRFIKDFEEFLQNGTLDICAGGLQRTVPNRNVIEYSGSYSSQIVIWIYSARRTPMAWERIKSRIGVLFPFFIIYICYCLVLIVFYNFDRRTINISNTFLYSWGILFGAASISQPSSAKQRILAFLYLLSCFFLSSYINAEVFTYLTIQLPPVTYRTDEDILASNKNCYLNTIWNTSSEDKDVQRLTNNCFKCSSSEDCIEKVLLNDGVAFSTDLLFYSFQVATAENYEATLLKVPQNLFTSYNNIMIRKDSLLVKRVQVLVKRMYETGITDKLITNGLGLGIEEKALIFSKNLRMFNYNCRKGCRVKLATLAPLFYIWMFGCLLSCFSFVLEVMIYKKSAK